MSSSMARILILLSFIFPLQVIAQLRIFGEGVDRGKFIIEENGGYLIACEVDDPKSYGFKFLVIARVNGQSVQAMQYRANMPFAMNDFIRNSAGNYVVLGERYLEGNRESMILLEVNSELVPLRTAASYENGNEVEPYDLLESGDDYYITGFTKTAELISNGFVYITKEKQRMYLSHFDHQLKHLESFVIDGFEENVNPVGRMMVVKDNSLILAGNIVGTGKSEIVVIRIDLSTKTIVWSVRLTGVQNLGVTDMLIQGGKIILQCSAADATGADHGIIIMNMAGSLIQSWNLNQEGLQRSHCMLVHSDDELILFGTSGKNQQESRRAVYLFSPATGKYAVNLTGNGVQSEVGRTARTREGYMNIGYEFFQKTGVDVVLRSYKEELFRDMSGSAGKLRLKSTYLQLKLNKYPDSSGIFESKLFKTEVNHSPYLRWNVD
jgi:hypothetical protein